MLVDVHGHFGRSTPGAVPPARVSTYAGVCDIDVVLVSNQDAASQPPGAADLEETDANMACLEACRAHRRLVPLYWVRLGRVDSHVEAFAGALASEPFVGAVFSPAAGSYDAADRLLEPYLRVLAQIGRPGLFCVGGDERAAPAKVYEQARGCPGITIVLCNCGPREAQGAAALDVVGLARQRQDADLYLDTSHADAAAVRAAVRTLGPERVVFGSNAVSYGSAHIPRHLALLEELRQTLPPDEFRQVAGENAVRLFGLDQRATG